MKKYIVLLVMFAILEIMLALYLTFWREAFWQAVSNKQSGAFIHQLIVFTGVACVICFVSGMSGYMVSLSAIKWREKLNAKALEVTNVKIENISQRIQADCMDYPTLCLTLGFGLVKAVVYIIVFCVTFLLTFSVTYLSVLVAYAIIGTIFTKLIAKPLIALNYKQQQVEATYRNGLTHGNFSECVRLMLGLAKKQKHLTYFQQFYNQVGVVIPLIIIAPEYFSSSMTLGLLMRFNSTSSTILDNMSYGISSFGDINRLLSCRKRLAEAGVV